MDEQEEVQQNNMISNLPLLFANGYPTSLDKITESQLENFIPFMVQCSLGHINLQGKVECSEPEWWPEDLPFTTPFSKPKKFIGNWMEKMKEVIIICYQFHKSVFLLRFCNDLAAYEHASLRFINNYNSTTSLFERRSNKLLVTFRNENMSYDQPQRSRKCLMQQKSKNGRQSGQDLQQMMVEPAPFDIYLCDNCDAELYSKEAILEHEKTCIVDDDDDDDVILCDTPEPPDDSQQLDPQSNNENNELRKGFLLNFNLQYREDNKKAKNEKLDSNGTSTGAATGAAGSAGEAKQDNVFMIVDKNKRVPRRNRAGHSLTRCPTIPLSSPAGQLLLRTTKTLMTPEYLIERLERTERFCFAPLLSKATSRPKYFERKTPLNPPHCTFKKSQENSSHVYVFPRRQFSQRRRTESFLFLNSSLIRRCRPISVRLKKISDHEMKGRRSAVNTKLNIKLTRDTSRSSNWKISSSPSTEIIVDTIDLCSSDEEDAAGVKTKVTTLQTTELYAAKTVTTAVATVPPVAVTSVATLSKAVNITRTRVKKSLSTPRLSTPEVSLIPIHKSLTNCTVKYDKIKLVASSDSANAATADERNASPSYYEGNILLSSSATVATDNAITLTKSLGPSVYIFSTTTPPLAAIVAATTSPDIVSTAEAAKFRAPLHQDNHVQSGQSTSLVIAKRPSNANAGAPPADWYGSANSLASSVHSATAASTTSSGNGNTNHLVERERPPRGLTLVQSFGSPGRVVSIDLTS